MNRKEKALKIIAEPVVKPPSSFTPEEHCEITALILRGKEVEPKGLAKRICEVHYLAAVYASGSIVGVGAIKKLDKHHKTVVRESGYKDLEMYSAEIGYLSVDHCLQGQGLGSQIVEALTNKWTKPLYAVTRVNNEGMGKILTSNHFERAGKEWASIQHPREKMCLWVGPISK